MLTALLLILGVGTIGGVAWYASTGHEEHPAGGGGPPPPLGPGPGPGGTIELTKDAWGMPCPVPPITNPNPSSSAPLPNEATAPGYQWCHVMRDGDSPETIVASVFGGVTPELALELRAYNPGRTFSYNEKINFPIRWNPWISQTGMPRGGIVPFPPYDKPTPAAPSSYTAPSFS
jgi:hypothetical protein